MVALPGGGAEQASRSAVLTPQREHQTTGVESQLPQEHVVW